MTAALHQRLAAVRMRIASGIAVVVGGLVVAAVAIAWRTGGIGMAAIVAVTGVVAGSAFAWSRWRRYDLPWLAGVLDARRRDLDDSTSLLFTEAATLGPLQRLQRERIVQRLQQQPAPDLRPPWPWRGIALAWLIAVLAVVGAIAWPRYGAPATPAATPEPGEAVVAAPPRLVAQSLAIQPPAYTGLPASKEMRLDAKAPVGARLQWSLRFEPQAQAVALVAHDGRRIAMQRDGDDWTATATLAASMLYRVVVQGVAAPSKLHRIDAVPDLPPRVRVRIPERSLTIVDALPRAWMLSFEVEDDHGVSAKARLLLTRTEGTGENIRFREHVLMLRGRGDRRALRFDARVDPSSYGLQRGEDLIARLEVRDNRAPQPQATRSASAILRWSAEPVLGAEGLEGMARQVLPAYFRSQRQIIIDAEALLKEKPELAEEAFAKRSDGIGIDQRLLRMRYGQFLGEESEGGAKPLPTSDLPTGDATNEDAGHDDHDHAQDDSDDHADHAHDATPGETPSGFGQAGDVLETYGHTHDLPEAATLLDPQTRDILRKALREMWQSELHLRQAAPQQALPYAYRALELIKQVQQADRIYLARVGSQLPPIDESRRLAGKREGIARRGLAPVPAPAHSGDALQAAWRSLGDAQAVPVATLDAVQAWADTHGARIADPLALVAAIDALRIDPDCGACREDLRGLLWSAMRRPDNGVPRRDAGNASGRRYLQLLGGDGGKP